MFKIVIVNYVPSILVNLVGHRVQFIDEAYN